MLKLLFAFLAGLLTVGAPCVLPLLPILLGTSVGQSSRTRPLFITLGFILTFSAVALLFTLFTRVLGISQEALRAVALVMLIMFGIFMLWPAPFEKLSLYMGKYTNKASEISDKSGSGNFGGFILGIMLGVIWTPCAGPVLGSIITLIVTSQDLARASGMLVAYAIGAGIPMLLIAYGGQYITTRVGKFSKYTRPIQKIFGVLILALAVAIYFQYDVKLQDKLARKIPGTLEIEKKLVEKYDKKHKVHSTSAYMEDEIVEEDPYFDGPAEEENILLTEIQTGSLYTEYLDSSQCVTEAKPANYKMPAHNLKPNTFALEGNWKFEEEKIILVKGSGKIKLRFHSDKISLKAQNKTKPVKIKYSLNNKNNEMQKTLEIKEKKSYLLFNKEDVEAEEKTEEQTLEIEILQPGLQISGFSFE